MLNTNGKIIKPKVGLLNLAEALGTVSKACKVMGVSRDTFYRYQAAVEEGGVEAGLERCGARRTWPTGSTSRPRRRWWRRLRSSRRMVSCAPATRCASGGSSSRPVAYAVSGGAMAWRTSSCGWRPGWRPWRGRSTTMRPVGRSRRPIPVIWGPRTRSTSAH